MDLLNTITNVAASALSGPAGGKLMETALALISNPQTGGLAGLVQNFRSQGLDDLVSSWIGTGQNLPLNAQQLENVLGLTNVQQVAQKLGMSGQDAATGLAGLLPEVIDKLTPDGKLPDNNSLNQLLGTVKNALLG